MALKQQTLTIWKEYTKEKEHICAPEYHDQEAREKRQRRIRTRGNFQDWDDYIIDRTVYPENKEQQSIKNQTQNNTQKRYNTLKLD